MTDLIDALRAALVEAGVEPCDWQLDYLRSHLDVTPRVTHVVVRRDTWGITATVTTDDGQQMTFGEVMAQYMASTPVDHRFRVAAAILMVLRRL